MTTQLGKLQGVDLKIAKQKFALSGQGLAHIRASLQTVAKMTVVDFSRILLHRNHQNKVQNTSLHAIGLKSMHFYLRFISEIRANNSSCSAQYVMLELLIIGIKYIFITLYNY